MFNNRALQVRLVKSSTPGDNPTTTEVQTLDLEQINAIAKDQVKHLAIVVGIVLVGKKLLDTACQIAVLKTLDPR